MSDSIGGPDTGTGTDSGAGTDAGSGTDSTMTGDTGGPDTTANDTGIVDTSNCEHTPTAEQCFNDFDDDCDGRVDCADSDCNPTAECVPVAPNFQLGTAVALNGSCPAEYSASTTPLYQDPGGGTDCSGCSCQSSISCAVKVSQYQGGCPGQIVRSYTLTSDACENNNGTGLGLANILKADAPTMQTACKPAGSGTLPMLAFSGSANFCATKSVGGGCMMNEKCVPKLQQGKHCANISGTTSCPAGYQAEGMGTWYGSFADNRSCSQCSCSSNPQGGSCGTKFTLYSDKNCTMMNGNNFPSNSDSCNASGPWDSGKIEANVMTQPTCSNQGASSKVLGSVTMSNEHTLCCK